MRGYFDTKINDFAWVMTVGIVRDKSQNPKPSESSLYNNKALMHNVATIAAIAFTALALFFLISSPVTVVGLAVSLSARYCIGKNMDKMFGRAVSLSPQIIDHRNERGRIASFLDEESFSLFRRQIPRDGDFSAGLKSDEKHSMTYEEFKSSPFDQILSGNS